MVYHNFTQVEPGRQVVVYNLTGGSPPLQVGLELSFNTLPIMAHVS